MTAHACGIGTYLFGEPQKAKRLVDVPDRILMGIHIAGRKQLSVCIQGRRETSSHLVERDRLEDNFDRRILVGLLKKLLVNP